MKRKEVYFECGLDIDDCYTMLQNFKSEDDSYIYYGSFNRKEINSEMTLDEAYVCATGKTKSEFETAREKFIKKIKEAEKEYKLKKAQLIEKAKRISIELISEEKLDEWNECIDQSFNEGIYQGEEIWSVIELIKLSKENKTLNEIKQCFDKQNHSGLSAGLVFFLLKSFCDNGKEIVDYIKKEER